MRDGGLRKIEHGIDVSAERVVPFIAAEFFQLRMSHLVSGIVHQNVEPSELGVDPFDKVAAVALLPDIARERQAFATGFPNPALRLAGVFRFLRKIGDRDVGALPREGNRNRTPNAAVAAR